MKKRKIHSIIIINTLMLVLSCNLRAQNYVTEHKSTITAYFDSLEVKYSIDITTDGFEYLNFTDDLMTVRYYFNASDTCIVYKMWFPEGGFSESVNALNRSFEKIDDSIWQEYDRRQYFIWSLDRSRSGYTISVFSKRRLDSGKLN